MPDSLRFAAAAATGTVVRAKRGPLLLLLAPEKLKLLFETGSPILSCGGRIRSMRTERVGSIQRLLTVMLRAACLQHDGSPCQVTKTEKGKEARPLTVPELAQRAGLGIRNAERCLRDLRDAGLLGRTPQIRRKNGLGMLGVAPVLRIFTAAFWRALGLWSLFVDSVRYAAEQAPIRMRIPLTWIGTTGRRMPRQKPVPLDRQLADLAQICLHEKGGSCDGDSRKLCQICRATRGLA